MIDHSTIDKIMDSADIVEVVQDFVSLKRRGVNYIGCCPFHNEKTPSFTVSPAKGIYKCFGCGKSGNVAGFIMEHEQSSYPEALKYLARKYSIPIVEKELSPEEKRVNDDKESMLIINSFAAKYFANNLLNTPEGISVGLSYFRERGFTDLAINTFGLGYSFEQRDAFTQEAIRSGYKSEFLEKTGLTIAHETRKFDRFSGRVMFPIYSMSGQVIGFGGRVLKTNEKTAKYLNSPESEIYNKSKTLYGLFQSKQEIIRQNKCYLVEGYTDVISLYMAGIHNVVASSGTSLTEEQIKIIHRLTENVTVLYDGDSAGIKASLRGIDMILAQGLNVKVLLFPDGEDPDSFSKKNGSEKTIAYLNAHEEDFISFKTRLLSADAQNDPIRRSGLINDIIRTIFVIEDPVKQAVYIQECSKILDIDEKVIYSGVEKLRQKKFLDKGISSQSYKNQENSAIPKQQEPSLKTIGNSIEFQERELIKTLLNFGNNIIKNPLDKSENPQEIMVANLIIGLFKNDGLKMRNDVNQKILELAETLLLNSEKIELKYFTQNPDVEVGKVAADLCSSNYQLSNIWAKYSPTVREFDEKGNIINCERKFEPYYSEEKKVGETIVDAYLKYSTKLCSEKKEKLANILKKKENECSQIKIQIEKLQSEYTLIADKESDNAKNLEKSISELINQKENIEKENFKILKEFINLAKIIKELSYRQGRVTI